MTLSDEDNPHVCPKCGGPADRVDWLCFGISGQTWTGSTCLKCPHRWRPVALEQERRAMLAANQKENGK